MDQEIDSLVHNAFTHYHGTDLRTGTDDADQEGRGDAKTGLPFRAVGEGVVELHPMLWF